MAKTLFTDQSALDAIRQSVTVAVVGTGSVGAAHLRVLSSGVASGVLAVPSRPARRAELAAQGVPVASDVREAVRAGAACAVIATDTGRHVADGLDALDAGLHLLVEKPLARDAGEALRLLRRARELGRRLYVGCTLRFSESLGVFRDILGSVGRLHAVRIECQSYLPDWRPARDYREAYSARAAEGGVLRDLIHEVDYAGWLFGWPAAVQARLRNLGQLGIEAEELAELSWETPSGCLVSVALDYLSRPARRRMRACGDAGTVEWDAIAGTVTIEHPGAPAEVRRSSQTRDHMLLAQDREFLLACAGGPTSRLATGEDGVRGVAVCDAARRASASGREEPVTYEAVG